mmetsp:Transcript_18897/g.21156  ORF Transcript_18897/g.21156 Transcript_18897/m.21156 type:complete len:275 (+) Transcript_18897:466-1290(+)
MSLPRREEVLHQVVLCQHLRGLLRRTELGARHAVPDDGVQELAVVSPAREEGGHTVVGPPSQLMPIVEVERYDGYSCVVRRPLYILARQLLHVIGHRAVLEALVPNHNVAQLPKHLIQPSRHLDPLVQGAGDGRGVRRLNRQIVQRRVGLAGAAVQQSKHGSHVVAEAVDEAARALAIVACVTQGATEEYTLEIRTPELKVHPGELAPLHHVWHHGLPENGLVEAPAQRANHHIVLLAVVVVSSHTVRESDLACRLILHQFSVGEVVAQVDGIQ